MVEGLAMIEIHFMFHDRFPAVVKHEMLRHISVQRTMAFVFFKSLPLSTLPDIAFLFTVFLSVVILCTTR